MILHMINFIPNYVISEKWKDQIYHLDYLNDHEKVFSVQKVSILVWKNFLERVSYIKPFGPFLELDKSLTEESV